MTGTMRNLKNLCLNVVDVPHVIVEVHIDKTQGFGHVQRTGKGVTIYQIVCIVGFNSNFLFFQGREP